MSKQPPSLEVQALEARIPGYCRAKLCYTAFSSLQSEPSLPPMCSGSPSPVPGDKSTHSARPAYHILQAGPTKNIRRIYAYFGRRAITHTHARSTAHPTRTRAATTIERSAR